MLLPLLLAAMAMVDVPLGADGESHEVFVSSHAGSDDDGSAGTQSSPFRTLTAAQRWVRARAPTMSRDITVHLTAGEHPVGEGLVLGAADSGRNGHKVVFRGAPGGASVISGAIDLLSGDWNRSGEVATHAVPCGTKSRQLYRDDERVPRARSPGEFAVFDGDVQATATGYVTSDARMAGWKTVQGLEFVYPRTLANGSEVYKTWTEHRIAVDAVEKVGEKLHVTMRQPA